MSAWLKPTGLHETRGGSVDDAPANFADSQGMGAPGTGTQTRNMGEIVRVHAEFGIEFG